MIEQNAELTATEPEGSTGWVHTLAEDDDVEGHSGLVFSLTDEDDVEGHIQPPRGDDTDYLRS